MVTHAVPYLGLVNDNIFTSRRGSVRIWWKKLALDRIRRYEIHSRVMAERQIDMAHAQRPSFSQSPPQCDVGSQPRAEWKASQILCINLEVEPTLIHAKRSLCASGESILARPHRSSHGRRQEMECHNDRGCARTQL